jgi:hypothetical protein
VTNRRGCAIGFILSYVGGQQRALPGEARRTLTFEKAAK